MDDQVWPVRMKKAQWEEQASGAGLVKEKGLQRKEDDATQNEASPTERLVSLG